MRKWIAVLVVGLALVSSTTRAENVTDDEIRQRLIKESIQSYPGNCPCPYNHASNGSRCGKRSAWSKPGGYEPLCYPADVSDQMVNQYRKVHSLPKSD